MVPLRAVSHWYSLSLITVKRTVKGPSRAGSIFFGEITEGITGGKSLLGSENRVRMGLFGTCEVSASPDGQQAPAGRRIMRGMLVPFFVQQVARTLARACVPSIRLCAMFLAFSLWPQPLIRAACMMTPRVCAEFFESDSVFTGVVMSERYWSSPHKDGRYYYRLKVKKVYRGTPQEVIEVFTNNDAGACDSMWVTDTCYLRGRMKGSYGLGAVEIQPN
jgi:hypothetical protein